MKTFFGFLFLLSLSAFSYQRVIVIDAGSTGSRVTVFKNEDGIAPEFFFKEKKLGGMHRLKESESISRYLDPVVNFLKMKLGESAQDTPVLIFATGGVRGLKQERRDSIMLQAKNYFKQNGFKSVKVQILSPSSEGMYAWIAVNYLLGRLGPGSREDTVGVLDMGGSSTQIAFVLSQNDARSAHEVSLNLMETEYRLYIRGYAGFGMRKALTRFAYQDCFESGLEEDPVSLREAELEFFLNSTCPASGNFNRCRYKITRHLASLGQIECQRTKGKFMALAGFAQLASPKVLAMSELSKETLEKHGRDVCAQPWQEFKSQGKDLPKFLATACFEAAYYAALFSKMYNFSSESHEIIPLNEVDGAEISWALGVAVFELNQ